MEHNLGATAPVISRIHTLRMGHSPSNWECQPEDKDELEGVVEWEPVDSADSALKDSQEGKDYPVLEKRL